MTTAQYGIARRERRQTVLCIEDDRASLALIERTLLRRPAVQLLIARDGAEGTRMAREHAPDAVLLDLSVGGMGGIGGLGGEEVLARLHADPATRAVPVVVLGAEQSASLGQRLMARGAQSYLAKPLDSAELWRVLEYALSWPYSAAA